MTARPPSNARSPSGPLGKAPKPVYECRECDHQHPKWSGQCVGCGAWNTLVEATYAAPHGGAAPARVQLALGELSRIDDVVAGGAAVRPTGIGELDRVLGGGLLAGSVTLLGGEPGIGKSTLALQLLQSWDGPTLYLSGEESPQQVKGRALRLGADLPDVWIGAETSLRGVLAAIDRVQPEVVVIDSIQTIADERIASSPGSATQVRECAQQLVGEAKRRGVAIVLVGHVTKDGAIAGPRTLEHVVDTVLSFEGDRHHALRLLRVVKHRFGATNELGLFGMHGEGLYGVEDPSQLFLADRRPWIPGSVVVPMIDGQRPLLVEVQALTVAAAQGGSPRRTAQGVDSGRLAMLLAVIERWLPIDVGRQEVYVSTVGGIRLSEPGSDLGIALAVISAGVSIPMPEDLVAIGEVGLGGELRQVIHTQRRLAEAARLGYRRALVPRSSPEVDGIESITVESLGDALAASLSLEHSSGPPPSSTS